MAKSSQNLSFATLSIDRADSTPLYLQLYHELRNAIATGRLRAHTRLPSSRSLAEDLGMSRKTVVDAFEQLTAEGYLEPRVGDGTYVSASLPEELFRPSAIIKGTRNLAGSRMRVSMRSEKIASLSSLFRPVKMIPFRHGLPALDAFPLKLWNQLAGKCHRNLPTQLLGYGDASGYYPLRKAISSYIGAVRAVRCDPEQVVIVAGSQQAVYLVALVLLDENDVALMEDPGYVGARGALQTAGARVVPVPVDEEGLRIDDGVKLHQNARLVYVTPSNQFPLTVTMSITRRMELLNWAKNSGTWIIEDDYDSEYRFTSRPFAALHALDRFDKVIYIGTFSKLLMPSLRIGYLVLPPELVDVFKAATAVISRHPPSIEQVVLTDFIEQGHLARHIRRMRILYKERQADFVEAAHREVGDILQITPPEAGMHIVGKLPTELNDNTVVSLAAEQGVEATALSKYYLGDAGQSGLLLGYGAFNKKQINIAMKRLASVLYKLCPKK